MWNLEIIISGMDHIVLKDRFVAVKWKGDTTHTPISFVALHSVKGILPKSEMTNLKVPCPLGKRHANGGRAEFTWARQQYY